MSAVNQIEEVLNDVLVNILKRANQVKGKDQLAIAQEFREWIEGNDSEEEIYVIDEFTFQKYK